MGTVSQIRDTAGTVWDIKDANAATSGHTHGLSIATDSGTNQLTMAANTKYKLTAGGSTYIFTTPPDNNSDTKVTQTNSTTSADNRLVLSATADDTTRTEAAVKSTNFRANPSTGEFYAKGFRRIDITGQTVNINDYNLSAGTPNMMFYIEKTDGGANNITNIPVAGKPFLLDVEVIRWASTSDYITRQTFRNANNPTNEYVRFCTNGTWGSWTTRVFTDANTNTWRNIKVNDTEILGTGTGTGALNLKAGTNVSLSNSSGTVTITSTDTNTHRPIQVNGTEILGNNTTALNLKAGSNVSVTNSSGTVTIAATDTTYTSQSAVSGDNTVSLCTRNEKYIWNNKSELQLGSTSTTAAPGNHTHSYAGSSTAGGAATQLTVTNTTTDSSYYVLGATGTGSQTVYSRTSVYFNGSTGVLYGAAWNDFAEYRETNAQPGEVVCETLNGDLVKSTKRLQLGAAAISDTYGMIIGDHTDTAQPIAVAGRVLVYIDTLDNVFAGAAVCAAPDGKVSIMSREEIKEYPDAIIGYISEVPKYDEWNGVQVNGRIWIKIK